MELVRELMIPLTVAVVAALEQFYPCKRNRPLLARRLITNVGLYLINSAILWALVHLTSGLSRVGDPLTISILGSDAFGRAAVLLCWFLALDLANYLLHRLLHATPILFRLHCAHHSDCDVDLSTAFRHHPAEFVLSCAVTFLVAAIIGAPMEVTATYAAITFTAQIWHHGRFELPPQTDRLLSFVIVTPAMHRMHHSLDETQSQSNFGTLLSVWDRLLGTKVETSVISEFGVRNFDAYEHQKLEVALLSPIISSLGRVE